MARPTSRPASGSRPISRTALDKSSITYGEMGPDEDIPVHSMFMNRRMQDPYLVNVFPAGFSLERAVQPPKYRQCFQSPENEGVREYIPVVYKPHSYQQRARTPGSPKSPVRGGVGDEFRHVAGPFFRQLEIDDSVNFGVTSVINLESTSIYSTEASKSREGGSLPSLPSHGRVLRSVPGMKTRHYMKPKINGKLVKGTLTSKVLAKLSPGAENTAVLDDNTILREALSFQSKSLQLNLSLFRLESALESESAASQLDPPRVVTVSFEYSYHSLQQLIANVVTKDSRAKNMKGKFTIDMKFFKVSEEAWVPMNSELQWIHAKSCALDYPGNSVRILYGAVNQADILRPPRHPSDEDDKLLIELKSKLNVHLRPVPEIHPQGGIEANTSFHSIDSASALSGLVGDDGSLIGRNLHGTTSLLFNDSVSTCGGGTRRRLSKQRENTGKQNMLASALEKRLTKCNK